MRYALPALGLGFGLLAAPAIAAESGPTPADVAVPAAAPAPVSTPQPAPAAAPFASRVLRDGRVLLAPQPQPDDFEALRAAGLRKVINLRAPEEMATLGFDQPALLSSKGIEHVALPVAGNAAFTPALLDAFSVAMADGEGDVLLHCASGARAGQLYAAWLVRERGLSPQEAMQRVAPLGLWPTPMERLLDRPLRLEFAEAPRG